MTYQHNTILQAQDDLNELQEKIVERKRAYFQQTGRSRTAEIALLSTLPEVSDVWAGQSASSWQTLFALREGVLDLASAKMPKPIADRYPVWHHDVYNHRDIDQYAVKFRVACAEAFGMNPAELFWTRSTTDAMMHCFRGIAWQKDDLCLTTNMEHSGGLGALYAAVNRFGVAPPQWGTPTYLDPERGQPASSGVFGLQHDGNVLSLPTGVALSEADACGYPLLPDADDYDRVFFKTRLEPSLNRIAAKYDGTLKVLFFSSPSFITGLRLPEAQLARWAWERKVWSFVDGAHLPGMVDIDLHAMGVDFFVSSGHKWQCGPTQTGMAYLRRGRRATPTDGQLLMETTPIAYTNTAYCNPNPVPEFWPDVGDAMREVMSFEPLSHMAFSHQEPEYPMLRGVYECCRLWDEIGRPLIDDYTVLLSQYLRWRLTQIRPITALSAEFRRTNGDGWRDMWHPVTDKARFPTHCRTGLTAWTPFAQRDFASDQPSVDACFALSDTQSQAQEYRAKHLLSQLGSQFGIYARTTRCPHQLRIGGGKYSANAMPDVGPVTASSPLRFSTYLYHQHQDIDRLIDALEHPDMGALYDLTV